MQMHDGEVIHHIYLCTYVSGEPYLPADSPEALENQALNRFKPGWVPLTELASLDLGYWQSTQSALISGVKNGFAEQLTVVMAARPR